MILELNLSSTQGFILITTLCLLISLISHNKSYIVIDIEEHDQAQSRPVSERYGAYLQSQSKYYN